MKKPLTLSIVLNGLLLAALGISLARHKTPAATPSVAATAEPAPAIEEAPTQRPFHWSQLEVTNDYRSYVANLRAAGCPESTLRAIVTADFEAATTFERHRLESAGESTSQLSSETVKQAVARALGEMAIPSAGEETAANSTKARVSPLQSMSVRPVAQKVAHASYPVAFQPAVLNDSTLTDNQKAAVRQLQQQFVDAVGGPNQDPADPTYGARWQTAQQDADEALRAQLGNQAYLAYKQQHYYSNFQQVMLNAGDGPVTINPEELAK